MKGVLNHSSELRYVSDGFQLLRNQKSIFMFSNFKFKPRNRWSIIKTWPCSNGFKYFNPDEMTFQKDVYLYRSEKRCIRDLSFLQTHGSGYYKIQENS